MGKADFTESEWQATSQKPVGTIPADVREHLRARLELYAQGPKWRKHIRKLDITFKGEYAYIDASKLTPPTDAVAQYKQAGFRGDWETPWHLCRLGWLGDENQWLFAFFRYSNEKYNPHLLTDGSHDATPEQALLLPDVAPSD